MIMQLTSRPDIAAARALIEHNGLRFEPAFDALYGVHDDGELIAVGARAGNVLKMLTVAAARRGGSLLGEVVSALVADGLNAGCATLFIYTKPALAHSFEALHFTPLAACAEAVWLEFGHGLRHWLAAQQTLRRPGANGALFLDSLTLAEAAARQIPVAAQRVDHLYVFVAGDAAWNELLPLARQASRGVGNAVVVDGGPYRNGEAVPGYFLPADAPLARLRAELDATVYAAHLAPFFGIVRHFANGEPDCTHAILAAHGIQPAAIPSANRSTSRGGNR